MYERYLRGKHFNSQVGSFDSVETSSIWVDELRIA